MRGPAIPVRTTPPAVQPVSTAEARDHCYVEHSDDDSLLDAFIEAATANLDGYSGLLGRCLISQAWQLSFCGWPGDRVFRLPFPDVSAAVVTYQDEDDTEATFASSGYELLEDASGSYIRFKDAATFPTLAFDRSDTVTVSFTAGYGADAVDVPMPLRQAIKMLAGHLYDHREAVAVGNGLTVDEMPFAVLWLIGPYRRRTL